MAAGEVATRRDLGGPRSIAGRSSFRHGILAVRGVQGTSSRESEYFPTKYSRCSNIRVSSNTFVDRAGWSHGSGSSHAFRETQSVEQLGW